MALLLTCVLGIGGAIAVIVLGAAIARGLGRGVKPKSPSAKPAGTLDVSLLAFSELFTVDLTARDPRALADPRLLDQPGVEALLSQMEGRAPWNPARRIWIRLPADECTPAMARDLQAALTAYATRREQAAAREHREFMWSSAGFLCVGIVLTMLGLATQLWLTRHPPSADPVITGLLSLGLDVAIWVALWAPVAAFLQDWVPLVRRRQRYRSLGRLPVRVLPLA
ncbi:MAG TPA: hypothetical protein VFQ80_04475 [Thermomicrobiales bacterium]|jgi:hypothetical protein|nr:hypothetical protein [Thermomicrobiales bacterium]